MTTISQSTTHATDSRERSPGLLHEISEFWRQFIVAAFNAYRPELHYMRGPGPAWRAKHRQSLH